MLASRVRSSAHAFARSHGLEAPKSSWGSDYLTIASVVLRPFSVGQVTLRSANMFEAPLIDPKYLTDKRDVQVLLEGMKLARRIARVEPLAELLSESVSPFDLDTATDEQVSSLTSRANLDPWLIRIDSPRHTSSSRT